MSYALNRSVSCVLGVCRGGVSRVVADVYCNRVLNGKCHCINRHLDIAALTYMNLPHVQCFKCQVTYVS